MDGSLRTIPRPRTYTRVLAVPRSTARSFEKMFASGPGSRRRSIGDRYSLATISLIVTRRFFSCSWGFPLSRREPTPIEWTRGSSTPFSTKYRRTASTRRWLSWTLYSRGPTESVYPARSTVSLGFSLSSLTRERSAVWAVSFRSHRSKPNWKCSVSARSRALRLSQSLVTRPFTSSARAWAASALPNASSDRCRADVAVPPTSPTEVSSRWTRWLPSLTSPSPLPKRWLVSASFLPSSCWTQFFEAHPVTTNTKPTTRTIIRKGSLIIRVLLSVVRPGC